MDIRHMLSRNAVRHSRTSHESLQWKMRKAESSQLETASLAKARQVKKWEPALWLELDIHMVMTWSL